MVGVGGAGGGGGWRGGGGWGGGGVGAGGDISRMVLRGADVASGWSWDRERERRGGGGGPLVGPGPVLLVVDAGGIETGGGLEQSEGEMSDGRNPGYGGRYGTCCGRRLNIDTHECHK